MPDKQAAALIAVESHGERASYLLEPAGDLIRVRAHKGSDGMHRPGIVVGMGSCIENGTRLQGPQRPEGGVGTPYRKFRHLLFNKKEKIIGPQTKCVFFQGMSWAEVRAGPSRADLKIAMGRAGPGREF